MVKNMRSILVKYGITIAIVVLSAYYLAARSFLGVPWYPFAGIATFMSSLTILLLFAYFDWQNLRAQPQSLTVESRAPYVNVLGNS